jgi:hypothetical protein
MSIDSIDTKLKIEKIILNATCFQDCKIIKKKKGNHFEIFKKAMENGLIVYLL